MPLTADGYKILQASAIIVDKKVTEMIKVGGTNVLRIMSGKCPETHTQYFNKCHNVQPYIYYKLDIIISILSSL